MKIFILFLILGLCKAAFRSKCDRDVPHIAEPYCGVLNDCYQTAGNLESLEIYSCERREKGLPDFTSKIEGECPTDKPRCPLLV